MPRIISARKVKSATATPKSPIEVEIRSSFFYRGVSPYSFSRSDSVLPIWVRGPTAHTIALPLPVSIRELFKTKGHGLLLRFSSVKGALRRASDSPVIEASSQLRSFELINTQSAGMLLPFSKTNTSPTTNSKASIVVFLPFLITMASA